MTHVPFERQIWSAARCAEYLEVSKSHFLNCIRYADGFPAPLPIPPYMVKDRQVNMDPRWKATAVASWALGDAQELHKTQQAA